MAASNSDTELIPIKIGERDGVGDFTTQKIWETSFSAFSGRPVVDSVRYEEDETKEAHCLCKDCAEEGRCIVRLPNKGHSPEQQNDDMGERIRICSQCNIKLDLCQRLSDPYTEDEPIETYPIAQRGQCFMAWVCFCSIELKSLVVNFPNEETCSRSSCKRKREEQDNVAILAPRRGK